MHYRHTSRTDLACVFASDEEPARLSAADLITIDPETVGSAPVSEGTRVPVKALFDYLEANYSPEEFLECFPSVTRDLACRGLARSESA